MLKLVSDSVRERLGHRVIKGFIPAQVGETLPALLIISPFSILTTP